MRSYGFTSYCYRVCWHVLSYVVWPRLPMCSDVFTYVDTFWFTCQCPILPYDFSSYSYRVCWHVLSYVVWPKKRPRRSLTQSSQIDCVIGVYAPPHLILVVRAGLYVPCRVVASHLTCVLWLDVCFGLGSTRYIVDVGLLFLPCGWRESPHSFAQWRHTKTQKIQQN